jgi:hypothetical protein
MCVLSCVRAREYYALTDLDHSAHGIACRLQRLREQTHRVHRSTDLQTIIKLRFYELFEINMTNLPLHFGVRATERLEHDHLSVHAADVGLGERVLRIKQCEHLHKQRLIEVGHGRLDWRRTCNSGYAHNVNTLCAQLTLVVELCHVREELIEQRRVLDVKTAVGGAEHRVQIARCFVQKLTCEF